MARLQTDDDPARGPLADALASAGSAVLLCDATRRDLPIVYANPAFERLFGSSMGALEGQPCWFMEVASEHTLRDAAKRRRSFEGPVQCKHADGTPLYVNVQAEPVRDPEGRIRHLVLTCTDVTRFYELERGALWAARHDSLTALPNRPTLRQRLHQSLLQARRHGRTVATFVLDLEGFQAINQALGHEAGDLLLKEVAERLGGQVRGDDTVARLGDDEYALVMADVAEEEDADRLARRTLQVFEEPFRLLGSDLVVKASLGVALYPRDSEDPDQLLSFAEVAMQRAKDSGGNRYRFFAHEFHERTRQRLTLEADLRRALSEDELDVHFQTQVDACTGRTVGVEGLVRWPHPSHGMISPGEFIPTAEMSDLILAVDHAVLQKSGQALAALAEQIPGIRASVNVSARHFHGNALPSMVRQLIAQYGLSPENIELEMTESALMENEEHTLSILEELGSLGVRLAIDDFGTGYSSFRRLQQMPIDTVKIDRSFVLTLGEQRGRRIVAALIEMARALELHTVAEGVEDAEQWTILRELGCDTIQGFAISRPAPFEDLQKALELEETSQVRPALRTSDVVPRTESVKGRVG